MGEMEVRAREVMGGDELRRRKVDGDESGGGGEEGDASSFKVRLYQVFGDNDEISW